MGTLEDTIRVQATTLDKIVFETNHVNVPKVFERMEMTFIETLRVYLWPYYTPSDSTIENVEFESGSYKTTTEMTFRQGTPSFDLKIVMPTQKVFFSNVRIAYPFSLFFPLTAVRSNVRLGLAKVASGPVQAYESCKSQSVRFRPSLATASTPSQSWRLPPGSSRLDHHPQLCPLPSFPSSRGKLKSAPRSLSSPLRSPRLTRHSLASVPS